MPPLFKVQFNTLNIPALVKWQILVYKQKKRRNHSSKTQLFDDIFLSPVTKIIFNAWFKSLIGRLKLQVTIFLYSVFFSWGSCCSCTTKSCFIKSVLILSCLMGGTLRWCCVFFFKLSEGKKSSRFGPCQSEIIVCLILSLMDDLEFSNGPAPMTNTILIFINCFDNANFDAVVKGLPKLAAKASELSKVAR